MMPPEEIENIFLKKYCELTEHDLQFITSDPIRKQIALDYMDEYIRLLNGLTIIKIIGDNLCSHKTHGHDSSKKENLI